MPLSEHVIKLSLALTLTLSGCDRPSETQTSEAPAQPPATEDVASAEAEDMTAPKVVRVEAGPEVQDRLQEALILAEPGSVVELGVGTFDLTDALSLDVDDVTVQGQGMDKSILSFANQAAGSEGLLVTSDRVVLKDFAVEDTKGDGIKAKGVDTISMVNLRVEWTRGPNPENGAYGLYPVMSKNVLVEGTHVIASSDAGIYVGQSENIIVRNNRAEYNVAGIEIENSYRADVYDNVAEHNTGGLLVFDMPGLPQMGGHSHRVYNNKIINNDTENFSAPGGIINVLPKGSGIIVFSQRNIHIFDNEISNHGTSNIMLVSFPQSFEDANMNPLVREVYIYNNTLGPAGFDPSGDLVAPLAAFTGGDIPSIIWDGASKYQIGEEIRQETPNIVIRDNGEVSYVSLGIEDAGLDFTKANPSMDLPGEGVTIPELAPVSLPQDGGTL